MKKTLILIAGLFCLTAANVFAVENVSFRLKGMHGDFEGLVKDEYTDMMYMPYNILEIDGYRLYTNLSNLSTGTTGTEMALDETAFSANQYLIGGVAPFGGFGKLGFIYGADSSLTPQTIRDESGASIGYTGEYEYIDDDKANSTYDRTYGKAERETLKSDISYLLGFQPVDVIKFGFLLNFSSDEDITTNDYSDRNNSLTPGVTNYSLVTSNVITGAPETYITLGPAVELQVNDKLTIGGMLGIILGEKEYGDSATQSWYSTPNFSGWWNSYDGWINSTCTYSRVDTSGKIGKPEGTGFELKGMGKYVVSDNLKLRGIFDYQSRSLSGNVITPGVISSIDGELGAGGWINDPVEGWIYVSDWVATETVKYDLTRSGDMTIKTNSIALGAGFENQMNKDLMLTMAIKYSVEEEQTDYSRDGVYRVNDVPTSYLSNIQDMEKDTVTNLILPIGMEYKANKWMTLRMGASHKITTTESEDRTTTTNYAATYPVKTVTTVMTTVDPKSTTIVRDTDYSFGAGFKVTDNLQIDLLNFTNLTDMSFWKLSATLKFYGNSETSSGRSSKINTNDGAELKKKYWTKAVREYNKANYEKAISYWEKILDIDPGHKASLQRIEQAQKMMKNYE
ncbi:MAG: hypothetical protein KKD35_08480 [Elusimicrobia bacterium]|nr:hypothetical protein [Elusimicrobiota bacterium]